MSDFLGRPPARPRPQPKPDQARTLEMLATLYLVALVVAMLYVGREIFIPIAIAIPVSFVLSPPILLLRRWGLGRVPSVLTVVIAGLVIAFLVSAVLTRQVSELAVDLPLYQATINAKIDKLRDAAADNALFAKVSAALQHLGEINPHRPAPSSVPAPSDQPKNQPAEGQENQPPAPGEVHQPAPGRSKALAALKNLGKIDPHRTAPSSVPAPSDQPKNQLTKGQENQPLIPVEGQESAWRPFAIVETIAGDALSSLERAFIVVILVIFILLQREDLRNRFIRLAGSSDLHRTTLAMNDAAGRLSRLFLVQTLVNASFGVIVAVGLYFIGLPSPILWGVVAFLLRFVPYFGPLIAAGFPMALAAAIDPGWSMALETLALFLFVETIIGQVVEPWLYGHKTGISPIAVVISATFWWWMWGTVGLVLSTPLTVCLLVLGRHVERLAFLDVIFGDAPALTPVENFYQRMLAGDESEVVDQAEQFLKTNSLVDYYDEVALPALLMAQVDLRRGVLDEQRQRRIKETIEEVIEDLSDHVDQPPASAPAPELVESFALETSGCPSLPSSAPSPSPISALNVEVRPPDLPPGGLMSSEESERPVLCIAGRSFLDEAAAALFAQILEKHGMGATVEPAGALTAGRISHLSAEGVRLVCLSYLDADFSAAGARFAVRRLRRHLGEIKILAGFWQSGPGQASELCAETNADFCATTFTEALAFCLLEAVELEKGTPGKISVKPAV
jgi:predicted PurR-regulated permease PerM